MPAFSGFGIRFVPEKRSNSTYIHNQSAFHLYDKFTIADLAHLVAVAEKSNEKTLWVPDMYNEPSKIGISTWYAKALLEYMNEKYNSHE